MSDSNADRDHLLLRRIIADTDQKLADAARKRQEVSLAPWQVMFTGLGSGAALFAAGAAFMRVFARS
jgi:hypothetical protein